MAQPQIWKKTNKDQPVLAPNLTQANREPFQAAVCTEEVWSFKTCCIKTSVAVCKGRTVMSFDADCWGGHKHLPLLSSHHPNAQGEVTQGEGCACFLCCYFRIWFVNFNSSDGPMMLSGEMQPELWPAAGREEPLVGQLSRCPTLSPQSRGAFLKTKNFKRVI